LISEVPSEFIDSTNPTVLQGGTEYVMSGTDSHTRILSGGIEYVESSGTASGTIIGNGGELVVSSGGTALESVIGSGGHEVVMSGGITSGVTIDHGGTLEFDSAYTGITQGVSFSDAGKEAAVLKFDAMATTSPGLIYDGVISGFDSPKDEIDLAGLGFVSGSTTVSSVLSGSNTILTVTNGSANVSLTLAGDRTADTFAVSADSGSGTTITDPSARSDLPFSWLGNSVAKVLSDFGGSGGYRSDTGFQQLLNKIENWDTGSGSTSSGGHIEPLIRPSFPMSGVDAGWHSYMVQTLASFDDGKGGPSPGSAIQTNEQNAQTVLAGNSPHHG
jgi:autotransporter passenger strand-loop-strand repeat protein